MGNDLTSNEAVVNDLQRVLRILRSYHHPNGIVLEPVEGTGKGTFMIEGDGQPRALKFADLPDFRKYPNAKVWDAAVDSLLQERGPAGFLGLLRELAPHLEAELRVTAHSEEDGAVIERVCVVHPGASEVEFLDEWGSPSITRGVDVIPWATVERVCPDEARAFELILAKHLTYNNDFAMGYSPGDPDELVNWMKVQIVDDALSEEEKAARARDAAGEIVAAWKGLQAAFADATRVGEAHLTLNIGYREPSDDEGSDLWGAMYAVGGAFQMTEAGKLLGDDLVRAARVRFNI